MTYHGILGDIVLLRLMVAVGMIQRYFLIRRTVRKQSLPLFTNVFERINHMSLCKPTVYGLSELIFHSFWVNKDKNLGPN